MLVNENPKILFDDRFQYDKTAISRRALQENNSLASLSESNPELN